MNERIKQAINDLKAGVRGDSAADLGAAIAGGVRAGGYWRGEAMAKKRGMVECPRIAPKRTHDTGWLRPEGVPTTFHGYWYGFQRCAAKTLGRNRGDLPYTFRCRRAKLEISA